MQKSNFNCTHEDVFFRVFVEKPFVFVILFFSILFPPISDFQASPLDDRALTESLNVEPAKGVDDEVLDWDEVEGKPEILKKVFGKCSSTNCSCFGCNCNRYRQPTNNK